MADVLQGSGPVTTATGPVSGPANRNALMWGGGLAAAGALAAIVYVAWRTWYKADLSHPAAYTLLGGLAAIYITAVVIASYAHEHGDIRETARLAGIIVVVTFAFVVIIAVVFIWFAATKDSNSSSSSSNSSKEPSGGGGSDGGAGTGGDSSSVAASDSGDHSTSYRHHDTLAEALLLGTAGTGYRDRDDVAVRAAAPAPSAGACPACGHKLTDGDRFCPGCGAAQAS